jgi:hypothetical protein
MTFTIRLEQADGTPADPPTIENRHELACRRDDPDRARIAYSFDEVAARSARRLDHVGRWRRRGLRVGSVVRLAVGSASDTREFESASRAVLVLVRGCGRARSDARRARVVWAASATAEASGRVTFPNVGPPNRSLRVVGIVVSNEDEPSVLIVEDVA